MEFTVSGKTDTGRKRQANEDALFFDPDRALAFVADGMGGHKGGATASQIAKHTISTYLEDCEKKGRLDKSSIVNAVREANARILKMSRENEALSGMGSTLSLIAFRGSTAIVGHVGDSRLYRYRDGTLQQLTSDHSWVQEQVKANIITEEQAKADARRHWILRALGQEDEIEVDVFHVKLRVNDVFLLCSDGLHDMVSDPKIAEIIAGSELRPVQLCEDLVHAANEHGGEDNISVVAIRVDGVSGTAARPAVMRGAVVLCLLLLSAVGLRIFRTPDEDEAGARPLMTDGVDMARAPVGPVGIETPPVRPEPKPVEREARGPVDKESRSPEPSLAEMKLLAQNGSLDKSARVSAYKKAAIMCVAENNLGEARDLLLAAVGLDAGLSYSDNDTLPFELDETALASLSKTVAEAKRAAYTEKRSTSGIDAKMRNLTDDAKGYVAAAGELSEKAERLAERGQLPEALDTVDLAAKEVDRALAEYHRDKAAYAEAVESTQTRLALLEGLESWNAKLLESDLKAIAASEEEMIELSHRGEFRSAIDHASDIRKQVGDIVARAAANNAAEQLATEAVDSAASLISAVETGLPGEYVARTKDLLDRFQRDVEDARVMTAEGRFEEAQSTAGRIAEGCKVTVDEIFRVLKEKRDSLLDALPERVSRGIEHVDLDKAFAAADAVGSAPKEAVPELVKLFNAAANALDGLDAAVKDAIEKDAAWRQETGQYLGQAETHLASAKERLQKGGGSDQGLRFWLKRCESGPLTDLAGVSGVPESFAQKVEELRVIVRSYGEKWSLHISGGELQQIEDRLEELRQIVADGAVQ